ncbi:unnamed protein product [Durusdinium trenchii]|uniref:Cilia- and flagella-associated protein 43 n=1 Tax=Durusdinium trenchii TaxID=1381693 RepID=A0ABP0LZ28_9DINO
MVICWRRTPESLGLTSRPRVETPRPLGSTGRWPWTLDNLFRAIGLRNGFRGGGCQVSGLSGAVGCVLAVPDSVVGLGIERPGRLELFVVQCFATLRLFYMKSRLRPLKSCHSENDWLKHSRLCEQPDRMSGSASEELPTWGCYAHRPYCNLLASAALSGDPCTPEFLLFDCKDKKLFLCRYVDTGTTTLCRSCCLCTNGALSNPRQLLLSPRRRVFASLEVINGRGSVAVWQLPAISDETELAAVAACRLGDVLPSDAEKTSKAICWAGPTLPPFCKSGEQIDLLSVLVAEKVLLVLVKVKPTETSEMGEVSLEQLHSVSISFPCRCLSWSNDGTQLLVGGKGQLSCFAFEDAQQVPLVRHLLCSGECVEIQTAFSNVFLCRIDQCVDPLPEPCLMLPGQGLNASPMPLVQVVENPQDGPSERPGSQSVPPFVSAWQNPELDTGLQVLPCQRYLLPIRCSLTEARDTLRLQCGVERPAGELLAVAETGGKALVVFGSFNSSEVQFSRLAPPHQWASEGIMGTESQSMWHGAATLSLLPQASLRLSGLALWRAAPAAPPELHAVLEAPSAAGEFGRPKRELFHRSESLAEEPMSPTTAPKHLEPSGEEGMDRGQEHSPRPGRGSQTSQTSQTLQTLQLQSIAENDFFEMLQCHSVRVLYDLRPTDFRGEFHARHQRFSLSALRGQCRARGIFFKSMPIGRESAYGTLAHIRSDEGQHTLVELAWQAKRKRTAFLGSQELWNEDNRQVIADELVKAGHQVLHVRSDGSTEQHVPGTQYPDWLVREEERLKLLEKKRQAGEAEKVSKSRLERSSEAVASRLARPTEEVDAMTELRLAANQKELVVAQRKLARYQRLADQKGLLANKVLTNVPEWVREDAMKQAEWVAAKKKEKADAEAAKAAAAARGDRLDAEDQPNGSESVGRCSGRRTSVGSRCHPLQRCSQLLRAFMAFILH